MSRVFAGMLFIALPLASCAEAEDEHDTSGFDAGLDREQDSAPDPDCPDPTVELPEPTDIHEDLPADAAEEPALDEHDALRDLEPEDAVPEDPLPEEAAEEDVLCGGTHCPPGHTCCFDTYCADLESDPENCGSCGHLCWPEVGDRCTAGACVCSGSGRPCTDPLTDYCCEGDGCRNLMTDDDHCGMCGWWCSVGEECIDGWCEGW